MSTNRQRTTEEDRVNGVRATLTTEFEAQTARLTKLTADTGDPAEAHTRAALIAATRRSLEQTTVALRRIAEGRYGRCDNCDASIPHERLEILPHARYCVPCQEKRG